MKRDIWSNQEDARELEVREFYKHTPLNILRILGRRRLGSYYWELECYNRHLIKKASSYGVFPFCRGWESDGWGEKYYYVTYRIFKNNFPQWFEITDEYPNIITEYDDYYMISLYTGTWNWWEIK